MNRLIIESIEGRIMLGITMFVAIMILVGWVAINEDARMTEFVEQHEGRSIERGAELFAANCSTCHGINGYGIAGRAPALNSPHFFGYNYLSEVNNQIASFQRDVADINGSETRAGSQSILEARRDELLNDFAVPGISEAEAQEILFELDNVDVTLSEDIDDVAARITAITEGEPLEADATLTDSQLEIRLVALQDNIPTRLANADAALNGDDGLLAERDTLLLDLDTAILRGYFPRLEEIRLEAEEEGDPMILTNYIAQDSDRLSQIGFGGGISGYITTTLIHGRPGSNIVWPAPMDSWSQRGGGPLRDDQIGDVVAYIMNWDKGDGWTIDDFNAVGQYAMIYEQYTVDDGTQSGDTQPAGGESDDIVLPAGDASRGESLYNGLEASELGVPLGCSGCHLNGAVGPDTIGTWTRVETQRLAEAQYDGATGELYLVEAIVEPESYIVPGYNGGLMPANYGDQMTAQDIADVIAFLQTQSE